MKISGSALAALGLLVAWTMSASCSYPSATAGTGLGGRGLFDPEGSTGSGDADLNSDLNDEDDTKDPNKPECGPESVIDAEGDCIPSCFESGSWCADGGDLSECNGYPIIEAHDCAVCCAIPEDEQQCPPEGCAEDEDIEDCPPNEICPFTLECPDGVCDEAAGEDCTTCPIDCLGCPVVCGDGICSQGFETCLDCADCECPETCGDGVCQVGDATTGETCENCSPDCGRCVKVLTWDINAGLKKGAGKVKTTLKSIANLIKIENPDFVGLQSVDQNTVRSGSVDQAHYVAKHVKMYKRFGAAFKYDSGYYGVAFLSKHEIHGMTKTKMATSDEWAKRRVLLTASLDLDDFYVLFHLGVTQLAKSTTPRVSQAKTIATDLGFEADALLVGNLNDGPLSSALVEFQDNGSLLDLWPDYGTGGKGLTTAKRRTDYVMAAFNWYDPAASGSCAFVVRSYVKPAKGLSSHRPVVAILQRGLGGADCGNATSGTDDSGLDDLGFGDTPCSTDAECAADPVYPVCAGGFCSECKSNADCTDPDFPTCTSAYQCL